MEQENKILEEKNKQEKQDIKPDETSKTENENSDSAKDTNLKETEKDCVESICSDNLDSKVDENILKSIGINVQEKSEKPSHSDIQVQMETDLVNLDKLIQYGMLDSKMGRILRKNILQKAFDNVVQVEKSKNIVQEKNKIFEEFSKNSNDFFKYDGRRDVLNYLKNEVSEIGINDLSKISEIVQIVEQSAIKRYLAKISHDKSLKDANEQAKQKLTANAQHSSDGANLSKTFSRAEIGKMSLKEFEKYENIIMKQLREGKFK